MNAQLRNLIGGGSPGRLKILPEYIGAGLQKTDAGPHGSVPSHGKGGAARLAGALAGIIGVGAIQRSKRLANPAVELIGRRFPAQHQQLGAGRVPGIEAGLFLKGRKAVPQTGQHIAVQMNRNVQLPANAVNGFQVIPVRLCGTTIDFNRYTPIFQEGNGTNCFLEAAGGMAERGISGIAAAIKGNIDPPGRMGRKKVRPVLVQQRAVGVDGDDHAQTPQLKIQFPEPGKEQWFAAGEQHKKHTGIGHTAGQRKPIRHGMQAATAAHLLRVQADIAHIAPQIAQRDELQRGGDGAAFGRRRLNEHSFHGGFGKMRFHRGRLLCKKLKRPELKKEPEGNPVLWGK